jgi:23S rRNA (uracil-5-)-methyltransferase RumA
MKSKEFRQYISQEVRRGAIDTARCPHAEQCGGCSFQDIAYVDQVQAKARALNAIWQESGYDGPPLTVVASPDAYEYRTRMDYVATKGRFGLRMRGKFNYIVDLETCHLIPPAGFAAAQAVWQLIGERGLPDYNIRTHEGFLRYVVVRRSPQNEFMLAAVTSAAPHDQQMGEVAALALAQPEVVSFHWLINDSLTDLSFGEPHRYWGLPTLAMQVGNATLQIGPNTFFQNNVHLLLPLLDAVRDGLEMPGIELNKVCVADLYGGVGTIALHLAPAVGEVVCVEAVAESVALAQLNIVANNVQNVRAIAQDVLPYLSQQAPGVHPLVVADPPRTGLGPEVCRELLRIAPQRIVYVSCNPLTQIDDLQILAEAYTLRSLTGYDMFPHTLHLESLAILDRR